jgi:hypothetical protein
MSITVRQIAGAAILGAATLAAILTQSLTHQALADQPTAKSLLDALSAGRVFDSSKLAKFGDGTYAVNVEPGVSQDVTAQHTIRKIAMGRTSFVQVVTTASGTYSSDGLASPFIRYPGIEAAPVDDYSAPYWMGGLLALSEDGKSWVALPLADAHSFSIWSHGNGTTVHTTNHGSCVWRRGVEVCV